jgi:hypothetical protein
MTVAYECGDCRFWFYHQRVELPDGARVGQCRRFPPSGIGEKAIIIRDYQQGELRVSAFPMISEHCWCGEFHVLSGGRPIAAPQQVPK